MDSAPAVILAAATAMTSKIRLTSAVSVLSAVAPVRLFQQSPTLDLISKGRAEMVMGRGSFSESFRLFDYNFMNYDALFEEKLSLLLQICEKEVLSWKSTFRASIANMGIYQQPMQQKLLIWLGIGGSPDSAIRAGRLGFPLMIAIIGDEIPSFKRYVNLHNEHAKKLNTSQTD